MKHVDKYELSQARIATVKAYAREYPDWVRKRAYMTTTTRTQRFDEPMGGTPGAGRPTEKLAIKRAQLSKKINLIEQTAKTADPFHYPYLLKGVTTGISYEKLLAEGMPCSRNTYYKHRRYFYWLLSEKMYKLGV